VQKFSAQQAKEKQKDSKPQRTMLFKTVSVQLAPPEPINLSSPPQLQKFFFDFLGLKPLDPAVRSTDKDFLAKYAPTVPEVALLKIFKEREKVLGTYLPGFSNSASQYSDYRVRADYKLFTITHRSSCENPNLQQIPRSGEKINTIKGLVKTVIRARPGYAIVNCDYATAEVRVLGLVARDPDLAEVFKKVDALKRDFLANPSKELYKKLKNEGDAHKQNAVKVFGKPIDQITKEERTATKSVTFKLCYDSYPVPSLAADLGITQEAAKALLNSFLGNFKRVNAWFAEVEKEAREFGYVRNIFGGRRALYGIHSLNRTDNNHAMNQSRNAPVQGPTAQIAFCAMYDFQQLVREARVDVRVINEIHDAIMLECPIDLLEEWVPKLLRIMERPPTAVALGIDFDFVPFSADCEIGLTYKDLVAWDDTPEHLVRLGDWCRAGAPKGEEPKSFYE
jgi:DNA polymerase-1